MLLCKLTLVIVDGRELVVGTKESLSVLNGAFSSTETNKNNATLVDDGKAQKLTAEDIQKLKGEGIARGELVEKIIENSVTFESKTEFAQEKYKRKKQKKYCTAMVLCRPTARNICESYFQKHPGKICGLRIDSLALLMNMANIAAHSKVLIFEHTPGLILASVLERLGGYGQVCTLHEGKVLMDIVRYLNFEERITSVGTYAKLDDIQKVKESSRMKAEETLGKDVDDDVETSNVTIKQIESEDQQKKTSQEVPTAKRQKMSAADKKTKNKVNGKGYEPKVKRVFFPKQASSDQMQDLVQGGFMNLIVVAPVYSPESIMDKLAYLLAPSATFALFSPWLQPLVECRIFLQSTKLAVGMHLTETFWREHQVLPGRSHPHMNMTTGPGSGYILCGTMTEEALHYTPKSSRQADS